ncbi:hypothetical protein KXW56_001719 [Aspergillus fumigatus]|nr:hypothetical protein KXX30_001493 [Aspergillus fumigatus]KAH1385028.1 hypothetical protein KXX50_005314 [Aspergillus fumigatus]KAH1414054.1 hypothetical protein KXX22_007625 [Aspergillus fumigatus]KAH1771982.1 hypothetical protein KXX07_001860 [Aspergillus fumigatus]KAH2452797.1 hypothetical protein KXV83_005576 [Aspergillus fumigatus]
MTRSHMSLDERADVVEDIIHYDFTNRSILYEALRSAGALALTGRAHRSDGNKDLAQVGDAVLQLILVMDGYEAKGSRGYINQIVSSTASNPNLAQASVSPGVMAQTVEAILGAVYLDSQMDVQAVRAVMASLSLGWPM